MLDIMIQIVDKLLGDTAYHFKICNLLAFFLSS